MAVLDRWGGLAKGDVMSMEEVEVAVVGGGQAGIAMSEHLSNAGVPHVILERGADRRAVALLALGLAGGERARLARPVPRAGVRPRPRTPSAGKEQVADYFEAYAKKIAAPVRCGVEVTSVRKNDGRPGFTVRDLRRRPQRPLRGRRDRAVPEARRPADRPRRPPAVEQLHSAALPQPRPAPATATSSWSAAGSSGVQIAAELQESGRQVYLSVGPHDRPPRRYRGRDYVWWLGVLGKWDMSTPPLGAEHVTIAVSGAQRRPHRRLPRSRRPGHHAGRPGPSYTDGTVRFRPDLRDNIAAGDANYLSVLDQADAYVARNGLDLPEEPRGPRARAPTRTA